MKMKRAGYFFKSFITAIAVLMLGGCTNLHKPSVYYLNYKAEQDEAWHRLDKEYTERTGIQVDIVTAASGNYETTLMSEMGKSSAPTMFQIQGSNDVQNWKDYCYDLSKTGIEDELTSDVYALKSEDKTVAVAFTLETYGIITNKTLLEKAGYSADEINSFDKLRSVAEDITKCKDELGFCAFTSAGMDESSAWRYKIHLANMPIYFEYRDKGINTSDKIDGTYLNNFRSIYDLYINNATVKGSELAAKTMDDARNEFIGKKAVFYQNGSWEYNALTESGAFSDDELMMLPIYCGTENEENQGLCTGTENYWCINSTVMQEDIDATVDFIKWCQTDPYAEKFMAEQMGFVCPFKNAEESKNVFMKQDDEMTKKGYIPVGWAFSTSPSYEWNNTLGSALTKYAASGDDDCWKDVEKCFTAKWAEEYELLKEG